MKKVLYVGLDVHAETIAVAVAESGRDREVRSLGTIANRIEAIGPCCEADPAGCFDYRQLTQLEVECEVIGPSLIPTGRVGRCETSGLLPRRGTHCGGRAEPRAGYDG